MIDKETYIKDYLTKYPDKTLFQAKNSYAWAKYREETGIDTNDYESLDDFRMDYSGRF